MSMTAEQVLACLRAHWCEAAIVPELVISDETAYVERGYGIRNSFQRRIDALAFRGLERIAVEIKVDRHDAARETAEKTRAWRKCTHKYVYVVTAGLINEPPIYGCGLLWVHPDGHVEVKKKAKGNRYPEPLPQAVVKNIALRATMPLNDALATLTELTSQETA